MKFLLKPNAIFCHLLCPALIFIFSGELLSGKSNYSKKELLLAIIFTIVAYVFVLFLIWLESYIKRKEIEDDILNPKSPKEKYQTRKTLRIFSLALIYLSAIFLIITGHKGWSVNFVPAHYVGYVLLVFGLAGSLGVNIWYKGPIDPRNDPEMN